MVISVFMIAISGINSTMRMAELWAKTTLLRGLLAWYGYSNDKMSFQCH